jgi:hypothetical protein
MASYYLKTKRFVSRVVSDNGHISEDEYLITKGIFSQIAEWTIKVLAVIGLITICSVCYLWL